MGFFPSLRKILQQDRQRIYSDLLRMIRTSVGLIVVGHVVMHYGFEIASPWGVSMEPTIAASGAWVLIDKTARRGRNIEVGDVVAFNHPVMDFRGIKRVIGMPGDFVLVGTPHAKGGDMEGKMVQVRK